MAQDGEAGRPPARRLLLGIDTGGTYTDAVLIDEARVDEGPAAVVAKAKALTSRDLATGIAGALDAVLAEVRASPAGVALVSLSTTLATNALVEGRGGRATLVMIGFGEADAGRAGLAEALAGEKPIRIAGGHDAMGEPRAPLDLAALGAALAGTDAEAFAVCSHFAVRNPAHELEARALIRRLTGRPVTCSHELSARVGGPKRALTALLNARLTGLIDRLIGAAQELLAARGVRAPLMVVRGDGALVSAAFARERPIETILSGPAASLVGAGWLSGLGDAVVSDIGGTTTDIAVLRGGRPRLDPAGASVGGWRTMVEAVAVTTHGLGGDSEVRAETGLDGGFSLGPRRAIPLSLLGAEEPAIHAVLDRQLARDRPGEQDGVFLVATGGARPAGLGTAETALLDGLAAGPLAAGDVLVARPMRSAARRLADRGLIRRAAPTPSDAQHVLGRLDAWDGAAAAKGLALLARQKTGRGTALAPSAEALAERIVARLVRRSAEVVLDAALAEDGLDGEAPSRHPLAAAALDRRDGLVRHRIALSAPLIGLGAPAAAYYPAVAATLGAADATPLHSEVANAVGAVVGGVRVQRTATITVPAEGLFRLHLPDGTSDHRSIEAARDAARRSLDALVRAAAAEAGAAQVETAFAEETRQAEVEGRAMLLETGITATATGRPRLAEADST